MRDGAASIFAVISSARSQAREAEFSLGDRRAAVVGICLKTKRCNTG